MISLTFSLLSLVALGVAQNQTVSLFLPNADMQSLVGSIVGGVSHSDLTLHHMRQADDEPCAQDATATTYVVQCANGGSDGAAATTAAATTAAAATTDAAAAAATDFGDDGSDDDDVCGFPTPITLVEGPSTVAYSLAVDDS